MEIIVSSITPPMVTSFNDKTWAMPGWIEVPLGTTIEDITWKQLFPKPAPGFKASDIDMRAYLNGMYVAPQPLNKSLPDLSIPVGEYTITRKFGKWSCECKGFGFRGNCKHVTEQKSLHE